MSKLLSWAFLTTCVFFTLLLGFLYLLYMERSISPYAPQISFLNFLSGVNVLPKTLSTVHPVIQITSLTSLFLFAQLAYALLIQKTLICSKQETNIFQSYKWAYKTIFSTKWFVVSISGILCFLLTAPNFYYSYNILQVATFLATIWLVAIFPLSAFNQDIIHSNQPKNWLKPVWPGFETYSLFLLFSCFYVLAIVKEITPENLILTALAIVFSISGTFIFTYLSFQILHNRSVYKNVFKTIKRTLPSRIYIGWLALFILLPFFAAIPFLIILFFLSWGYSDILPKLVSRYKNTDINLSETFKSFLNWLDNFSYGYAESTYMLICTLLLTFLTLSTGRYFYLSLQNHTKKES